MCARFDLNDRRLAPGRSIGAWVGPGRGERFVWAGFARRESLGWWTRKGGGLVDIPATRYAERSRVTGELVWADLPEGFVIRGLLDPNDGQPLVKVVTRACDAKDLEFFGHDRICVVEEPRFSDEPVNGQETSQRTLL